MIRVNNIHLSLDYDDKSVRKAVAQQLRIEEKSIKSCKIFRRSVDARKKDNIYFLTTVDAELNINEEKVCKKCGNAQIARKYEYNQMKFGNAPSPVIVGAGPAGLFAALILARSGAKPILIERASAFPSSTIVSKSFSSVVVSSACTGRVFINELRITNAVRKNLLPFFNMFFISFSFPLGCCNKKSENFSSLK